MRLAWQVATFSSGALGVFMAIQSLHYTLYDATGPRAGFFPFWLSVLLVIASFGMLLKVSLDGTMAAAKFRLMPERAAAIRVLLVLGGTLVVMLLLEVLGFRLTLLLFLLYVPAVLGSRNWITTAVVAVAGSFGVYYVFTSWLQVPLPVGQLGI